MVAREKPYCEVEYVGIGRSRSSEVVDFGTNRKHVCNFLLVFNSNLGPILSRFRDIAASLLKIVVPPPVNPNFGDVPLDRRCWRFKERIPKANYLCNYFRTNAANTTTVRQRIQTDG